MMTSAPHFPPILPALLLWFHYTNLPVAPWTWFPLSGFCLFSQPPFCLGSGILTLIHLEDSSNLTSFKKPVSSGFLFTPSEHP